METDLLKLRYNIKKFAFDSFGGDFLIQNSNTSVYGQILEVIHNQISSNNLEAYLQEIGVLVLDL
jgi:hypothetical protein